MILGIDLRSLPSDGSDGAGIAHASRAITGAILEAAPTDWTIKFYLPRGSSFPEFRTPVHPNHECQIVSLTGSRRSNLLRGLGTSPCDLLFVPSGAIPLNLPVPALPWVHDLDIFDHPEWFPQSWFTRMRTTWMFRRELLRARMIFAVSEYTKKQVGSREWGVGSEIVVTGEGGDSVLAAISDDHLEDEKTKASLRVTERFGLRHPFALILGTVEPRKNIIGILNIWPSLPSHTLKSGSHTHPLAALLIAGKLGWKHQPILQAIQNAERLCEKDHIIRLESFDDETRRDLLLAASFTLLPSKSEGFGLVGLESAQAGTPCLMSNAGALPELFGQGPWLLPLDDEGAWREAIIHLLSDASFSTEIASTQRNISKEWTWKKAGERIIEGIKNVE